MKKYGFLFAVLLLNLSAWGKLELPAIISDNMVLQSGGTAGNGKVTLWGWADPSQKVTVKASWGGGTSSIADEKGNWIVQLKVPDASIKKTYTLSFYAGKDSKIVKNVMVGEVWLCSGQSNMQWPVKGVKDSEKEVKNANYPQIRIFTLPRWVANSVPMEKNIVGNWKICSPETIEKLSATAYFFGRNLSKSLNTSVGLIDSSWGGTRIETWFSLDTAKQFEPTMASKIVADKQAEKTTIEECKKRIAEIHKNAKKIDAEYPAKYEAWKKGGKKGRAPRRSWVQIRSAIHPRFKRNYVSNLYNNMIYPIRMYTIKGAIWYQGESNEGNASIYDQLLVAMIKDWRKSFNCGDFPFICVQLPNYRQAWTLPVQDDRWPVLREAFAKVSKDMPNVYYTVNIDIGEAQNIHPKNKQEVGRRLGLMALRKVYGKGGFAWDGPKMSSVKIKDDKVIVRYSSGGAPLKRGDRINGFGLVDRNGKIFVAEVKIISDDTVELYAPGANNICVVAYAWADNPAGANLRNTAELPAAPFKCGFVPAFNAQKRMLPNLDKKYELVYAIDLKKFGSRVKPNYKTNNANSITQPFKRVAYLLGTEKDGKDEYVFVEFDAFSDDVKKIGIPSKSSNARFQQNISNVIVKSNTNKVIQGTFADGCCMEFWDCNYGQSNTAKIPGASDKVFDFGDQMGTTSPGYGSMQVHNFAQKQTIFAVNKFGPDPDIGIGNSDPKVCNNHLDWTFSPREVKDYDQAELRVYIVK